MKRKIIIIVCIVLAAALGVYIAGAIKQIKAGGEGRIQWLEKLRKENAENLPLIKMDGDETEEKKVAHYMVLITDSFDTIGTEISEIFDYYNIAYTDDASGFDPETRLCNGIDVYGSYELSVKSNLIAAIDNGDDFYIGVGFNDERDYYSVTNIEAMCRFLLDYIDGGVLDKLEINKDGF